MLFSGFKQDINKTSNRDHKGADSTDVFQHIIFKYHVNLADWMIFCYSPFNVPLEISWCQNSGEGTKGPHILNDRWSCDKASHVNVAGDQRPRRRKLPGLCGRCSFRSTWDLRVSVPHWAGWTTMVFESYLQGHWKWAIHMGPNLFVTVDVGKT